MQKNDDDDRTVEGPLSPEEIDRCGTVEPSEPPPARQRVNLMTFRLPPRATVELVEDRREPRTWRVEAEYRGEIKQEIPYARIPVTLLDRERLAPYLKIKGLRGERPAHAEMRFQPAPSKQDAEREAKLRPGEDRPANIFGADDRVVYRDTSFPWRCVGRVRTSQGTCTGCTIGPRLVLTASHCIDWLAGGGAGWVRFSPAYYNGDGPWGELIATRVIYWNRAQGGLTDQETAFDYAVLVLQEPHGLGYPGYRTYDDAWNGQDVWQHMGYPGDLTGTQRPAFQNRCAIETTESESLSGQTGYVLGHFNDITGGHSGGPVWGWWGNEPWPRVVGVQSAEAATPSRDTSGDNEFGGGPALSALIAWARSNYP